MKAVIFDMDGLLVDTEPFWRKAEIEVFAEVGLSLTENDCRETMGWRLAEVVALWHSRQPWSEPDLKSVEGKILNRVERYIRHQAKPLPGVAEALELCKSLGLKTAIASSSPMRLIDAMVDRFQLRAEFDGIYSAEHLSHGKPHPEIFLNAAHGLDIGVRDCLVLEDSIHGMVAALAARMYCAVIPAPEDADKAPFAAAHLQLNSLLELDAKHIGGLG